MGKTQTLEKEILQVMDDYWASYLSGDLERWASYLPEDYHNIGTNKEEEWNSKKEIIDYTKKTFSNAVGKAELRNKEAQIIEYPPYYMVHELGDIYIKVEDEWTYYARLRLSSLLEQTEEGWKVLHQHGSYPDSKSEEGEAFGFDELKIENKKLQDVIKSRTIELEQQKRELEIDAALERIRSQSLQMQHSSELDETSRIFHEQLLSLGIPSEISYVWLPDVENQKHKFWAAWTNSKKKTKKILSHSVTYDLDMEEPHTKICFDVWQSDEKYHIVHITPKELKGFFKSWKEILGGAENLNSKNFPEGIYYAEAYMKYGCFGININRPLKKDEEEILGRFALEFQRTYTRFLDLQKAETQAREAQIEASMERVRAAAMAMQDSDELDGVLSVLCEQFDLLGILPMSTHMTVFNWEDNTFTFRETGKYGDRSFGEQTVNLDAMDTWKDTVDRWKEGKATEVNRLHFPKETLPQVWEVFHESFASMPEGSRIYPKDYPDGLYHTAGRHPFGYIGMNQTRPATPEEEEIVIKFAKEFGMAYQRFLDLKKAESQAREAQIEAGLERLRSASMAMHKSEQLHDVVNVLYKELHPLTEDFDIVNIMLNIKPKGLHFWNGLGEKVYDDLYHIPYSDLPLIKAITQAWRRNDGFIELPHTRKEKDLYFKMAYNYMPVPANRKKMINKAEGMVVMGYFNNNTGINLIRYKTELFSEETKNIVTRFSKVFEQTYTRFLDLQKAEAQAKEAKIEVALERVRAQALAMHHTSELQGVISKLHNELLQLEISIDGGSFIAINEDIKDELRLWGAGGTANTSEEVIIPRFEKPFYLNLIDKIKKGKGLFAEKFTEREKQEFFKFLLEHNPWSGLSEKEKKETLSAAGPYTRSTYINKNTSLIIINHLGKPFTDDEHRILERFSKVFEQSYTRFLDLKKAEAQAREAQIEASLERVRSKAMAMHSSADLSSAASMVFTELRKLGVNPIRSGVALFKKGSRKVQLYSATSSESGDSLSLVGWAELKDHPVLDKVYESMLRQEDYFPVLQGEQMRKFYQLLLKGFSVPIPDFKKEQTQFGHMIFSSISFLYAWSDAHFSEDQIKIFRRFASIVDLTFRRFLDLKKAEAQTREAQIEMALEKVRSRTMAMHSSLDVGNTMVLLFEELESLGIKANRNGIILLDDEEHGEIWTAKPNINGVVELISWELDMSLHDLTKQVYRAWKNKNSGSVYPLIGDDLKAYYKVLNKYTDIPVKFNLDTLPEKEWCYTFNFNEGFIYLFIDEKMLQEYEQIPERFASVFGQTYRRYQDLQKAEAQAREAQIEAAMERIRSRAIAMRSSDELLEVALEIRIQTDLLGQQDLEASVVHLYRKDAAFFESMAAMRTPGDEGKITTHRLQFPVDATPEIEQMMANYWSELSQYTIELNQNQRERWEKILEKYAPEIFKQRLQFDADDVAANRKEYWNFADFSGGSLLTVTYAPPSADTNELFRRAADVFDLAYKRYKDLQKAEEQAREAEIEVALERIRSRSMAMHKSDELSEVILILFGQLELLNLVIDTCYIDIFDEDNRAFNIWIGAGTAIYPEQVHLPYSNHPIHQLNKKARKNNLDFYSFDEDKKSKDLYFEHFYAKAEGIDVPENRKKDIAEGLGISGSAALGEHSGITMWNYRKIKYSSEENEILVRVNKVFQQTYTRFLDLQKAEAQAREAQIEAALEKVRSRTMAMQHSDELSETSLVLFEQFKNLGEISHQISIGIINEDEKIMELYSTVQGEKWKEVAKVDLTNTLAMKKIYSGWKKKNKSLIIDLKGKELKQYNAYREKLSNLRYEEERWVIHVAFFSKGAITFSSIAPYPNETINLLERFASVFDGTYRRFLDLEKAEAQVREAQIEAALERVRARSMAMHKSEELLDVIKVVSEQLRDLDFRFNHVSFANNDLDKDYKFWVSFKGGPKPIFLKIPFVDIQIFTSLKEAQGKKEPFFTHVLSVKDHKIWHKHLLKHSPPDIFSKVDNDYIMSKGLARSAAINENIILIVANMASIPYSKEQNKIIERFGKVFEQSYTRFLDLQKAEAQAKESQIEAALERVRARSMAMHKSEELLNVVKTLYGEFKALNVDPDTVGIHLQKDDSKDLYLWLSTADGLYDNIVYWPYQDLRIINEFHKSRISGNLLEVSFEKAETKQFFEEYFKLDSVPKQRKSAIEKFEVMEWIGSFLKHTGLFLIKYQKVQYSDEEKDIVKRFAKVFEQTYVRFLDLQKAEAQAREAQIEAALERLRSKTMAMHNSEDMESTVITLFDEVSKLGLDDSIRCGIGILEHNPDYMETYSAKSSPDGTIDLTNGILNMNVHPMLVDVKNSWKEGMTSFQYEFDNKDLRKYYSALNNEPDYPFNRNLETMPENEYQKGFFFKEGILFAFAPKPIQEEAGRILKRFAAVFGQTYTRFLDLQRAEAQAREAQIEAALERVRSKAMAMRSSEDISEATTILFHEIEKLDIETMRCGIVIINKNKVMDAWTSSTIDSDEVINITGQIDMTIHPLLLNVYASWEKGESYTEFELKNEDGEAYYEALRKEANYNLPTTFEQRKQHFCFSFNFEEGAIFTFTRNRIPENSISIFERFARVFGLTYQRYRELIESEKREKEAKKQASLDRVRGEIASMRSTQDLDRITPIIWSELINLGVPFFRCGVFIMNDEEQNIDVFLSDPNGKSLGLMNLDYDTNFITTESVEAWKKETIYKAHWDKEGFMAWTKTLSDLGKIKTSKEYQGGDDAPESLHLHFVPFSQGMLYVGHLEPLNEDQLALVRNLAKSFSIAYARYEDFTKLEKAKENIETTLTDLKSTQKQLIQSEKMASLGELTAGIAHEIQNPLNFVNNFSEVSSELIDEIAEEMANGDMEEVKAILADIKENLEKINHHGKRADGIVKGMLQHSRTNSGEKELTDINQLADEYFNLAYHGLRAKEKSFNATLETYFDPQIGKINIVPQEIGRVLLNLINNAFYACTESNNKNLSGFENLTGLSNYKPTVILKTSLIQPSEGTKGGVKITVEDNGSGMPKEVMDKIFQPFFTTKPTGQGTGLGLSMSYDIIHAHGGDLEVDSTEGEGTKFTITIPNKEN